MLHENGDMESHISIFTHNIFGMQFKWNPLQIIWTRFLILASHHLLPKTPPHHTPNQTTNYRPGYLHWENYLFAAGVHEGGGYNINGPAVEINYGPLPDTQLSVTIPMTSVGGNAPSASGLGDIQLGLKYRFVQETNGWPQMAFYPAITLPTGDASRALGNGRAWFQLPLWLQKSWGPWTTYAGGGPAFNSVPGQRNFPFGGWLLQRNLGKVFLLAVNCMLKAGKGMTTVHLLH